MLVIKKEGTEFVVRNKQTGERICPLDLKHNEGCYGLNILTLLDVGPRSTEAKSSAKSQNHQEKNGGGNNELSKREPKR